MRRIAAIVLVAIASSPAVAPAAKVAERGTIEGVVVNAVTRKPQAGVRVTLTKARRDAGGRDTTTIVTDRRGRYVFDDLRTGERFLYSVDAVFRAGLFPGKVITLPDDTSRAPVIDTRLRVWPTTTEPSAILVRRDDIFAIPSGDEVSVIESVTVLNQSPRAYIGRGGTSQRSSGASLGFALPTGAAERGVQIIERSTTLDTLGLVATDFGFAITTAVPPGENRVVYAYTVTSSGGTATLSRTALYPTVELSILAATPLEVRSNRLRPEGEVAVGGRDYNRYSTTEAIDAGDELQAVTIAQAGSAPAATLAAVAALAAAIALIATIAFRRRRRSAAVQREPPTRSDILKEIAILDLNFEAGDIARSEWTRRRAALKSRLERVH